MGEIHPKGPYNILAVSWGGALAIEVARKLESKNLKANIYFVDSAPDTIQSAIALLHDGVGLEINLICKLLNVNSNEVSKSYIVAI